MDEEFHGKREAGSGDDRVDDRKRNKDDDKIGNEARHGFETGREKNRTRAASLKKLSAQNHTH